jgi:hypothetical protein
MKPTYYPNYQRLVLAMHDVFNQIRALLSPVISREVYA